MNTFEVKNVTFVSGLHWQILSGKPSEFKADVRKLARHLSFDLAVLRTTGTPQVGMAATNEGFKAGMLSAACVVSKTVEIESNSRDFVCASQLPDGRFLYVCQWDGVITAEGDRIGTEDEIRSQMLEDLSVEKNWDLLVAPMEWGISDSVERSFEDFIPRKKGKLDLKHSWWALKSTEVSVSGFLKKILPIMLMLLIAIGGGFGYKMWQAKKAAEEAARLAALEQSNTGGKVVPHPWKSQPKASEIVSNCSFAFGGLRTLWPGNWQPIQATCSAAASNLTVAWRRGENGWISHLLEIEPRATVSSDGTQASLVVPLPAATLFEDEELIDERKRTLEMHGAAQQVRASLTLSTPPEQPVLPGAPQQQVPPWKEMSWSVKASPLSPGVVIPAMVGPGFRVTNIVAVFNGGIITWDMEGTQYVQR